MSVKPISRKKIVVSRTPRHTSYSYGLKRYTARYEGYVVAQGDSADEAREEAVRSLVLTGEYIDPRPASKGGAR